MGHPNPIAPWYPNQQVPQLSANQVTANCMLQPAYNKSDAQGITPILSCTINRDAETSATLYGCTLMTAVKPEQGYLCVQTPQQHKPLAVFLMTTRTIAALVHRLHECCICIAQTPPTSMYLAGAPA